jgi:Na+-driven multidrug efflux pump
MILAFSIIPFSFGSITARWLERASLMKIQNQRILCAATLNIILNLWLIPVYGALGAAVATVVAMVFQFILTPFLCSEFESDFKRLVYCIAHPSFSFGK